MPETNYSPDELEVMQAQNIKPSVWDMLKPDVRQRIVTRHKRAKTAAPVNPDAPAPEADDDEGDTIKKPRNPGTGRPVVYGPDFTGDDPTSVYYPGEIAPAAAGERAKAEQAQERIKSFINKYSKLAVDRFAGSSTAGDVSISGPKAGSALQTLTPRFGKTGGIKGVSQMLSKDKALQLVDEIPMAPQDEAIQKQKELARYIWSIHANARPAFRKAVLKKLGLDNNKILTVQKRDADNNVYYDTVKPSETEKFKTLLAAVSEQFDADSTQVKADLNLLSSAAGALKRGAGKSGAADATVFQKKPQFGKPPKVVPREPSTRLSPELQRLSKYQSEPFDQEPEGPKSNPFTGEPTQLHDPLEPVRTEPEDRAMMDPDRVSVPGGGLPVASKFPKQKPINPHHSSSTSGARGPIIRKKSAHESYDPAFDRWVNEVIEYAVADRTPHWWDEI